MRAYNLAAISYLKFILVILIPMLNGCETVMDMDRPLPPANLLWVKSGASIETIDVEKKQCLALFVNATNAEKSNARDIYDLCMLRKGFTFIPKPDGWRNICAIDIFAKGIACQSTRRGFTLPP